MTLQTFSNRGDERGRGHAEIQPAKSYTKSVKSEILFIL
jgi:hypothetical protein